MSNAEVDGFTVAPWLSNFFVEASDPGYLYLIENNGLFKIGRTIKPDKRFREAKTWLPDMNVVGVKPFWQFAEKERLMHIGFACSWYKREWFKPYDEGIEEILIDDFVAFSDTDINRNSVDFIYWFNGGGMAEFVIEQARQNKTVRKFLEGETWLRDEKEDYQE